MYVFKVNDISCNHCVQAITQAALEVDSNARINVDIADKTVSIESNTAQPLFKAAITEAGYTPE
ncbi:heavy-metal-associated domain-containing protein [Methylobacillus caricis]|uniref:heavy-metal-associated domain-containing protein n=1 Tax=Methylobacillus caricis TaxID=1971611 RepID=UPI001CFF54B6|nr:heavy-metal-associated domain-containing protein [Methylobacillus caricis]MCB5187868.1 heavy-metal-associated domain-containing protein [Methylobacillus caricis]